MLVEGIFKNFPFGLDDKIKIHTCTICQFFLVLPKQACACSNYSVIISNFLNHNYHLKKVTNTQIKIENSSFCHLTFYLHFLVSNKYNLIIYNIQYNKCCTYEIQRSN